MARIAINPGEGRGTIYLSNQNTDSEITLYLPIDNTSATLLTKENSDATLANYVTQDAMEEYVGLHVSSVPTGTIMFFAGSTAPEGFIVWQNIKIYQTQYPNLYAVLNTAGGFAKGTDSTGAYVTLPDINGRVLQATTTASQVGALLEASLPDIIGYTQIVGFVQTDWSGASGVFQSSNRFNRSVQVEKGVNGADINFRAADGNAIYAGSTLQPKAINLLPCIRY